LRAGQDRRPYGAEEAVADARNIVAEYGRLPNVRALRAADYPRLATFISTNCGGTARFIAEYLDEPSRRA
jgi:hypothetical protein